MNIKKVSDRFGVPEPTLRYWEDLGLIPKVPRNKSGYRDYGEKEIKWILFTVAMRRAGMPLTSLQRLVNLYHNDHDNYSAQKALIKEQYDKMIKQRDELDNTLDYLKYKLDHFEEHYIPFLDEAKHYQLYAKQLEDDVKARRQDEPKQKG